MKSKRNTIEYTGLQLATRMKNMKIEYTNLVIITRQSNTGNQASIAYLRGQYVIKAVIEEAEKYKNIIQKELGKEVRVSII